MNVPYCDLPAQHAPLREELLRAVGRVLDSCSFGLGDEVRNFETSFAAAIGTEHAIAVSNGSDALHLALLSAGVRPGDEVVVPAMTFAATAAAVEWCSARPVCADIDETACMCPRSFAAVASAKTRAVVPVHLYGQPADMDGISAVAAKRGIVVVEDAAQAHLAEWRGKCCGALGSIASFSFYPSKNLGSCGEGGMITTNNGDMAAQARARRNWGEKHKVKGFNRRMQAMQAAMLNVKLKHLSNWNEARRTAAARYFALLADVDGVRLLKARAEVLHVHHVFAVLVSDRERAKCAFAKHGIGFGVHYPRPLHLYPCFADWGYQQGDFPAAEKFSEQVISLPMFPEISEEQICMVCDALRSAGL